MAAPVKARWIDPFWNALDTVCPAREQSGDGWIGDKAHQAETSGHNPDDTPGVKAERQDADNKPEVRAADTSTRLNHAKITVYMIIAAILAYRPDRDKLIYIIYNRTIWSAANNWAPKPYHGGDPHDTHFHMSGAASADENASPWWSILALATSQPPPPEDDVNLTDMIAQADWDKPPAEWKAEPAGEPLQFQVMMGGLHRRAYLNYKGLNYLSAQNAALTEVVKQLGSVIATGGGNVDTAAILAGVDERLAVLAAETRDAVADLGEGGAAQVRADAPPGSGSE